MISRVTDLTDTEDSCPRQPARRHARWSWSLVTAIDETMTEVEVAEEGTMMDMGRETLDMKDKKTQTGQRQ